MLQALRFFMNFVPPVIQIVVQKSFEKAMMPKNFQSSLLTCGGQPCAMMLLIFHQHRFMAGELLEHPCDRSSTDP